MTDPLKFIPPRVPLLDARTGLITREWYLFFQGVFDRIGGANAPTPEDLSASFFEDAGSGETNAILFTVEQALSQMPPDAVQLVVDTLLTEVAELREQVAELKKDLDAIRQGTLI
jgi:hypothetical protein